ncbi:MAG: hypothetical protein ACJ72D_16495 [Marmoricola sp.]
MTEPDRLLSRLVGSRLYTVQFGPDHLQLRFESDTSNHLPFLDCDVLPLVQQGGSSHHPAGPGYADALVDLIGAEVAGTGCEPGSGVTIMLVGGSVTLDPHADEIPGDEIGTLGGFDDGSSVVWSPGEGAFDHLDRA